MKKIIFLWALLCITLTFLPLNLYSLEIPPLLKRVNDYANMISPSVRLELEEKLAKLEETDSTQIAILTVTDLQGVTVEEYSMEVAKKWKIGQQKLNNGVIFLVAKEDRKLRIEVGYGLEGRLTDILAGRILDNEVRPHFRAGNYDEGFRRGVDGIIKAVKGEYHASMAPTNLSARRNNSNMVGTLIAIGLIFLIIALIVLGYRNIYAAIIAGAIAFPILLFLVVPFEIALFFSYILMGAFLGLIFGFIGSTFAPSDSTTYSGYDSSSYFSWSSSSSYSYSSSYSSSTSDSWSGGGGGFGGGGASSDW